MTITEQMIHLNNGQFWVILAFLAGLSILSFYGALRFFRRNRIIVDTPTARIRSAPQGYVELAGVAQLEKDQPVIAPLTDTPCCWYRYKIERESDNKWRTVEKGDSEIAFVIEDDTGRCLVLPSGAEVTASERSVWYGNSKQPTDRNPPRQKITATAGHFHISINTGVSANFADLLKTRYRYTEERIYPGDILYALGHFHSLGETEHSQSKRQLTRDILKFWKQDQTRLVQRFDQNNDGRIDADEWQQAQDAATRIAAEKHAEQKLQQVPHSLGKPRDKAFPFLISSLPQFALAQRYRILFWLSLAAFFITGSGAVFILSQRW
ncbi:MAG: GIDE domain-containing protein [Chromatiales bacterium]|jgi:hypothetical protein